MGDAGYRFEQIDGIYVVERATGAGLVLDGVKRLLRIASRALYVFPVLALVKLAWRGPGSDVITIAFVVVVLVFFALLALFLLVFPFAGPRSERRPDRRFAPPRTCDVALGRLGITAPAQGLPVALGGAVDGAPPLRLRGKLARLDPRGLVSGTPVLADAWTGTSRRVLEGVPFAVLVGNVPAIVELESPPVIAARYADQTLQLHDGNEVELVATDYRVVENVEAVEVCGVHFSPSTSASAYRSGRTAGLHVVCRPASPVVIAPC